MGRAFRGCAPTVVLAFVAFMARAAAAADPTDTASDLRLRGAATVLPTAGGVVAVGGPSLRRLAPGGQRWETLHTVKGDNLYRVAADEAGRVLAAWSKERLIHLFGAGKVARTSFPKPAAPPGVTGFEISTLAFVPGGRDALAIMTGRVQVATGSFRGPSWSTSAYRIALDGQTVERLLFRVDHGYRLHTSPFGAVFAMPKNPGQKCDHNECSITAVVAQEIAGDGARERVLWRTPELEVGRASVLRGSDERRVDLLLELTRPRRLELLRWRYGDARPETRTLPWTDSADATLFWTRAGELLRFRKHDDRLEIERLLPQGAAPVATLGALQSMDLGLHGLGERDDGLWVHYGDHVGLLAPGKPPRAFDLAPRLPRRHEWAGADVHVAAADQLWVGIDGPGNRDYLRVDLADADRRATPWPAAPQVHVVATGGEEVGEYPLDASTPDRLFGAVTLRPMRGGLHSIGGPGLRRLVDGARRWEVVHTVPKDSLYRAVADESGRILAAWENDPFIRLFSPATRGQIAFPKPRGPADALDRFQVDHLAFLPGGRDALVVMQGQIKNPPSRPVPEPIRFYSSSWATEAYRLPLDGRSEPRLLYQERHAYRVFDSDTGSVFVMPKYDGQECAHSTCMPITAIVAHRITAAGVERHIIVRGDGFGENTYLSRVAVVRGSDDDRVALVLGLIKNQGKQWLHGGRVLLRWRRGGGKPELRVLPGHEALSPAWLLTKSGDFIELERRGEKPEYLDLHRYPPGDGARSTVSLRSLTRMADPKGMGERAGGGLWIHYGEHVALFDPSGAARAVSLAPFLPRGFEWAGAAAYVPSPEAVWIGLDGRGRNFVRVDLAGAAKRAPEWR